MLPQAEKGERVGQADADKEVKGDHDIFKCSYLPVCDSSSVARADL